MLIEWLGLGVAKLSNKLFYGFGQGWAEPGAQTHTYRLGSMVKYFWSRFLFIRSSDFGLKIWWDYLNNVYGIFDWKAECDWGGDHEGDDDGAGDFLRVSLMIFRLGSNTENKQWYCSMDKYML